MKRHFAIRIAAFLFPAHQRRSFRAVNGWNLGAYYTDTNAKDAGYTLAGRNIGRAPGHRVRAEDVLIDVPQQPQGA